MILSRGGTNGKHIWSRRAVEERTEKSKAGSPTLHRRTSGVGKRRLERATYIVYVGSKADQHRSEKAMGAGSEWIEARSGRSQNNGFHSCEANDLSSRQKENRGCAAGEMGEVESGEEGLTYDARIRPATFGGGLFSLMTNYSGSAGR